MTSPLRLAYLVFVHKNPDQLVRLVKRLSCKGSTFYVHVDAKENLNSFRAAAHQLSTEKVVWLTKRKAISWGDFSLSEAYLSSFQAILQHRPEPDFIITISGQDYPLVTNGAIQNWLGHHVDQTILDYSLVTDDSPHLVERVEQYYLSVKRHHNLVYPHPNPDKLRKRLFNRALHLSGLFSLPRQMPLGHQLYFGTNWFQLKPLAARYLISFARSNPSYLRFFRYTYVPEEIFFQTILLNAAESIRNTIHNKRITFMQWDRPEGSYTEPISTHELPYMLNSGKLFARKFDPQHSSAVLDQLDQYLDGQRLIA